MNWERDPKAVRDKLANAYQAPAQSAPTPAANASYNLTGTVLSFSPQRKQELELERQRLSRALSTSE
jgi:hypothetical protein